MTEHNQDNITLAELLQTCTNLETAIRNGDLEAAQELVRILAQHNTRVSVNLEDLTTSKRKVCVRVTCDDTNFPFIDLRVDPQITIGNVKVMIHAKLGIPPDLQQLTIGKSIMKDHEVLAICDLTSDPCLVQLHILPATISKADENNLHQRILPNTDGSKRLCLEGAPTAPANACTVNLVQDTADDDQLHHEALPSTSGKLPGAGPRNKSKIVPRVRSDVEIVIIDPLENLEMWSCDGCTYFNHPDLQECEVCGSQRLGGALENQNHFIGHDPEEVRLKNYDDHLLINQFKIVTNLEVFQCAICLEDCQPGDGVVLRECLHMFCGTCLENLIQHSEDPTVACPFNNGDYQCHSTLLESEIKELVSDEIFQKHLQRSLTRAESQARNSYHCATPNCIGWCIYEDEVNTFYCSVCRHENCLTCRAIHERMDCIQHQRHMKAKHQTDYAAKMAQSSLEELFRMGEALKCPTCGIVIMKKEGCDWIMCTMCKTEICWVTRQARWGPKGNGDTSGGCRCRVNGKLCHPTCQNCH